MRTIRQSASLPRLITAAAGTALALSLTGCGLLGGGSDDPSATEGSESAAPEAAESSPGGGSSSEGAMGTMAPSEETSGSKAPEPTESKSEDPYADAATTTNWASDDAMKVDKKGNGTVPARSIEVDLTDLFENKLDMEVKKAECASDMDLKEWYGFETCDVTVKDTTRTDNKKTYYGTVKIVDHKDKMIKYELQFPGIDKEDFDFKD